MPGGVPRPHSRREHLATLDVQVRAPNARLRLRCRGAGPPCNFSPAHADFRGGRGQFRPAPAQFLRQMKVWFRHPICPLSMCVALRNQLTAVTS